MTCIITWRLGGGEERKGGGGGGGGGGGVEMEQQKRLVYTTCMSLYLRIENVYDIYSPHKMYVH